jgi:hypothetical protein
MMKSKMMANGSMMKSKMMASGGMMKKSAASGGVSDMAGPQGKTMSQPTKKSVTGETVSVRGVGAARAQKATIY